MTEIALFNSFAKGRQTRIVRGSNCVIYTRVSTKEQADNNLSLDTQRKACNGYAQKHNYTVLANFGGTYESAQTDERKEFSAMLSYVKKCRERISYIIVYSLERFSRNDNSIWLSGELRKLGIEIVSVTQPIDTSGPSGQMQQKCYSFSANLITNCVSKSVWPGRKKCCCVETGQLCRRSAMILSG